MGLNHEARLPSVARPFLPQGVSLPFPNECDNAGDGGIALENKSRERCRGIACSGILTRQKAALETRRNDVCKMLRQERDEEYALLLEGQRAQRHRLTQRQADGLKTHALLNVAYGVRFERDIHYETPPERVTSRDDSQRATAPQSREQQPNRQGRKDPIRRVRDPVDAAGGLGLGALGALATIAERLLEGFFGGSEPSPPARRDPEPDTSREDDAAERSAAQQAQAQSEEVERARLVAAWEERRQRKRERD